MKKEQKNRYNSDTSDNIGHGLLHSGSKDKFEIGRNNDHSISQKFKLGSLGGIFKKGSVSKNKFKSSTAGLHDEDKWENIEAPITSLDIGATRQEYKDHSFAVNKSKALRSSF